MNKRANYIYELVGRITKWETKKKKDGQPFIQLAVVIPEHPNSKKINVFTDSLAKPEICQEIEQKNYHGKDYLFFCKNYMGIYYLIDWQELTNHGSN